MLQHNSKNTNTEQSMLKTATEKHHVIYKGRPTRITADVSKETLKSRRAWNDVFKALSPNCQFKGLYPENPAVII